MQTRMFVCLTGVLLLAGSAVQTASATQNLLGVDWPNGVLYDVSTTTGATSNPRATGTSNLTGIAEGQDGFFYAIQAGSPGSLFKINPLTGSSTFVGLTNKEFITEGDLDFDPTDQTLYAIQETASGSNNRSLFTVNIADGSSVEVGVITPDGDLSAMAFDSSGQLWVLNTAFNDDWLLKVNKLTGAVQQSWALSTPLGATAGMDFDADTGQLYVADGFANGTDKLYTLSNSGGTEGTLTEIGSTGLSNGLAGLEFSAIPEPTSLALLAIGGLFIARRRR